MHLSAFGDEECNIAPVIPDASVKWAAHVAADAKIL